MSIINIHSATGGHPLLERLNLFPGRYLGEAEFDKRQKYVDYRLSQLGNPVLPGILQGLEILSQESDEQWISVSPGTAIDNLGQVIGLTHRVRQSWQALVLQYQLEADIDDAQGIYYLSLRRTSDIIDGSDINDACRKRALDPHRDIQAVIKGELFLKRLAISSSLIANAGADNIANHICAAQVEQQNFSFMSAGIPLALMALTKKDYHYGFKWIRPEAGRYLSTNNSSEKTLSQQVATTMTKVVKSIYQDKLLNNFADEFEQRLDLNFLPAIGQLPTPLLEKPAAFIITNEQREVLDGPNIRFFPAGNNIDMIPVPESSIAGIIQREQARGVIDLSEGNNSIRLLLVVNDKDYKADLLDFPEPDRSIENALYQYSQRAHKQWLKWKKQFYALYYVLDKNELNEHQIASLQLPDSIHWPQPASDFFTQLINNEHQQRGTKKLTDLPLPYRNGVPAAPKSYSDWLDNNKPPLAPRPKKNGLVVESILNAEEIESTQNSIRSKGILLEKIHDLLVLQRQQLDINTVSMATLAGGVASDGSGMQIARWWPHMDFEKVSETANNETQESDPAAGDNVNAASMVTDTIINEQANDLFMVKNISPLLANVTTPINKKPDSSNTLYNMGFTPLKQFNTLDIQSTPLYEYSAKFDLLNIVSNQQKSKVSEPLFTVANKKFGVLKHLQPEVNEYQIARQGIDDLFNAYEEIFGAKELAALKLQLDNVHKLPIKNEFIKLADDANNKSETSNQGKMNEAMFKISRLLLRFISIVELRNDTLEQEILTLKKELKNLYGMRARLLKIINIEQNKLQSLNKIRLEYLGDYNMAQSLLSEEWLRVEQQHDHRSHVLQSLKGLYYVKVRRTPISTAIAQQKTLYYHYEGDLLPGCHLNDTSEIPDSLDSFYDAILEIPIKYWQPLQSQLHLLPNTKKIDQLNKIHQSRLKSKMQIIPGSTLPYFNTLLQQNNSIMFELGQQSITIEQSKTQLHKQVQQVFSLEDLNQLRTGKLRQAALKLKDELSQCILCLLKNLKSVSPAIRLQWAQLAEDDLMPLETFDNWPGLQTADKDDFEPVKNIKVLVQWWFTQSTKYTADYSLQNKTESITIAASHSARRNMIRAVLIEAAYGDTTEILQGKIQTIPPIFRPGEIFRLKLNREAFPGIKLDLLSPAQKKVGQLQIEDEDEQGVIARVVHISNANIQINSKYSVIESLVSTHLTTNSNNSSQIANRV